MRRKRVETYFALYLTAIIAFLVVASERDKVEAELRSKNEKILAAFLRSASVETERDTLYWNVDADDRSGIIRAKGQSFKTFVRVRDIKSEDSVSMTVSSIIYNNDTVTDPSIIRVGEYIPETNINQPVVLFPVECVFPKTGNYDVSLNIKTTRIHEMPSGDLRYNDFVFSSELIGKEKRDRVERNATRFTVIVQDTSVPYPIAVQQIAINAAEPKIVSAIGFEESNEIFVNLPGTKPQVRVVYGSGSIEQRNSDDGEVKFFWKGQVRHTIDSIVVEARVNRGAGGKDIARTSFILMPNEPFLITSHPNAAYAGEDFEMSIQVEGLNNAAAYSWTLVLNGQVKHSGSNPTVRYSIPRGYENTDLTINALYEGKVYRCITRTNRRVSESNFSFKVVKPPAHIFFDPPSEVTSLHVFSFDAVRYGRRKFEKPIPFNEVEVRAESDRGENIPIDVSMSTEGSYSFNFQNPKRFLRNAQDVTITIRAADAFAQEVVRVLKK